MSSPKESHLVRLRLGHYRRVAIGKCALLNPTSSSPHLFLDSPRSSRKNVEAPENTSCLPCEEKCLWCSSTNACCSCALVLCPNKPCSASINGRSCLPCCLTSVEVPMKIYTDGDDGNYSKTSQPSSSASPPPPTQQAPTSGQSKEQDPEEVRRLQAQIKELKEELERKPSPAPTSEIKYVRSASQDERIQQLERDLENARDEAAKRDLENARDEGAKRDLENARDEGAKRDLENAGDEAAEVQAPAPPPPPPPPPPDMVEVECQTIELQPLFERSDNFMEGVEVNILISGMGETKKTVLRIEYDLRCIVLKRAGKTRFFPVKFVEALRCNQMELESLQSMGLLKEIGDPNIRIAMLTQGFRKPFVIDFPKPELKELFYKHVTALMEISQVEDDLTLNIPMEHQKALAEAMGGHKNNITSDDIFETPPGSPDAEKKRKSTKIRKSQPKLEEPVSSETKKSQPKLEEPVSSKTKKSQPKLEEPVSSETKKSQPKLEEPASSGTRKSQPKVVEPVSSETKKSQPKLEEPVSSKTKKSQPKLEEPVSSGTKKSQPKLEEPVSSETRKSQPKLEEPVSSETENPMSPKTGSPSSPKTGSPTSPKTGSPTSPKSGSPTSPKTGKFVAPKAKRSKASKSGNPPKGPPSRLARGDL